MDDVVVGTRVVVTRGTYEGKRGTVWLVRGTKELGVDFDTPHRGDSNAYVRRTSVRTLPSPTHTPPTT